MSTLYFMWGTRSVQHHTVSKSHLDDYIIYKFISNAFAISSPRHATASSAVRWAPNSQYLRGKTEACACLGRWAR